MQTNPTPSNVEDIGPKKVPKPKFKDVWPRRILSVAWAVCLVLGAANATLDSEPWCWSIKTVSTDRNGYAQTQVEKSCFGNPLPEEPERIEILDRSSGVQQYPQGSTSSREYALTKRQ